MSKESNAARTTAPSAKSQSTAPSAPVAAGGATAPTETLKGAATETTKPAPAEKTNRKVLGGDAFNRLQTAGASIVILASKGKLHSSVLTQLGGNVVPVNADLIKRVTGLTKNWPQFDRGYLVGPAASYSACAVNNGSKKAKGTAAFVYAVPGEGDADPTLMTADGNVWTRPLSGQREQGVYDAALAAAKTAFAG